MGCFRFLINNIPVKAESLSQAILKCNTMDELKEFKSLLLSRTSTSEVFIPEKIMVLTKLKISNEPGFKFQDFCMAPYILRHYLLAQFRRRYSFYFKYTRYGNIAFENVPSGWSIENDDGRELLVETSSAPSTPSPIRSPAASVMDWLPSTQDSSIVFE